MIIIKINGQMIKNIPHYYSLLKNQTGENVLLTYTVKGEEYSQVFKPISKGAMNNLVYERYVKNRNKQVETLSKGE